MVIASSSRSLWTTTSLVMALLTPNSSAQAPVHTESGPVHSLRLTPDGSRLLVVDPIGHRLSVFDLRDPRAPFLLAEIPVGLEPVSVHARTAEEAWVCNMLSDTISIVNLSERTVVATLRAVDEPSDVVFAGGKAFVSTATTDRVLVFDAQTRTPLGSIAVFGKDPRALATSPDGSRVYAVIQRSGNGTTILPTSVAPLPPPPTNPSLPPAPAQSIIVRASDPAYAQWIPYSLPDYDIAEIDVGSATVRRYFAAVGTNNFGLAVHPGTGDLYVANTEARNLVRFEPNLRGHAIDSRITRITTGAQPVVTPIDLNPGINYQVLPNPAALATALAEPHGVAIDAAAARIYISAHGTDRIGVLDLNGQVLARIEVGNTPGTLIDTRRKRGPRSLALHPTANLLYVHNHLAGTIGVVDTLAQTIVAEMPVATVDPMPAQLREGRKFLYDAKLAGNGTMSCAACHVDGDTDGLAWDLGNPGGVMEPAPAQPLPFRLGVGPFHPMKGPMTTQTLRGLGGTEPLHWRGDRSDFAAFNAAFDELLGGNHLSSADMADFAAYGTQIAFPPNPNQQLDRSLRTTPTNNNEAAGLQAFQAVVANLPNLGPASCASCHALPTGTNRMVISGIVLQSSQAIKTPQLRNMYRKVGMRRQAGPQKAGFGFIHDGSVDTLTNFLNLQVFNGWPAATKDDLVTFLMSFDTGMAPAVGFQRTLDANSVGTPTANGDLQLLRSQAAIGNLDLIAQGRFRGRLAGLYYDATTGRFQTDRSGESTLTSAELEQEVLQGSALLTFTGVLPGEGWRLAIDRDGDGVRDGDELPFTYGAASPGCGPAPQLWGNSEPRLAAAHFGYGASQAPTSSVGFLVLGLLPAALPIAGVQLLVEPSTSAVSFVQSDARGTAMHRLPLPSSPGLVGLSLHAQIGWLDPCAPAGLSASAGVGLVLRP